MKTAKEIAEESYPKNIFPSSWARNVLESKINQFKKETEIEIANKLDAMDYDGINIWIKSTLI